MVPNWFIESLKWRKLVLKIEFISIKISIKAILHGLFYSLITPNRIGEIPGRLIVLSKKNRIKGLIAGGLAGLSQMLVTLLFGLISFLYFIIFIQTDILRFNNSQIKYLLIISFVLLLIIVFVFFNINKIIKTLSKYSVFYKVKKHIVYLRYLSLNELFTVFIYATLRYFIYLFQYYLLLLFFDISISVFNAFISISLIYFFLTFVPRFSIAELGLRGSIAIFVLSYYTNNDFGIIATSSLLWFINLAIPALFGSYFVLKSNRLF